MSLQRIPTQSLQFIPHQSDFAAHIWWNYKQAVFTKENTIFQCNIRLQPPMQVVFTIPLIGISDISVKQQVLYISAYMHNAVFTDNNLHAGLHSQRNLSVMRSRFQHSLHAGKRTRVQSSVYMQVLRLHARQLHRFSL